MDISKNDVYNKKRHKLLKPLSITPKNATIGTAQSEINFLDNHLSSLHL